MDPQQCTQWHIHSLSLRKTVSEKYRKEIIKQSKCANSSKGCKSIGAGKNYDKILKSNRK